MNKIGTVIIVIGVVIACYLILLVTIPTVVVDLVESANATMTANTDLTNYPGSQPFLLAIPWIMWFVPGVIGIAAIVIILRRP